MKQKTLVEKDFSSAKRIELDVIESKNELKAYRRILDYFHGYKNWTHIPARRIRWIVYADGEAVGVIGIASSPMNVGCRDKWIGWNKEQKKANLQKIANNYRFCMMVRGLGSRVLSALYKEARRRWEEKYGDKLVLLDTFVEPPYDGTVYKASGWIYVGKTKGYKIKRPPSKALLASVMDGKEGKAHAERAKLLLENPEEAVKKYPYLRHEVEEGGVQKLVFVKPLVRWWRKELLK